MLNENIVHHRRSCACDPIVCLPLFRLVVVGHSIVLPPRRVNRICFAPHPDELLRLHGSDKGLVAWKAGVHGAVLAFGSNHIPNIVQHRNPPVTRSKRDTINALPGGRTLWLLLRYQRVQLRRKLSPVLRKYSPCEPHLTISQPLFSREALADLAVDLVEPLTILGRRAITKG